MLLPMVEVPLRGSVRSAVVLIDSPALLFLFLFLLLDTVSLLPDLLIEDGRIVLSVVLSMIKGVLRFELTGILLVEVRELVRVPRLFSPGGRRTIRKRKEPVNIVHARKGRHIWREMSEKVAVREWGKLRSS